MNSSRSALSPRDTTKVQLIIRNILLLVYHRKFLKGLCVQRKITDHIDIVTCVRFPWLNNVSTATTIG
jgi:hypothetical protein